MLERIARVFRDPAKYWEILDLATTYDLWVFEGRELHGGRPLTIAYAGDGPFGEYLGMIAFTGEFKRYPVGPTRIWSLIGRLRGFDCDALFCETPWPKEGFFPLPVFARLPAWARMELDLREDRSASARSKYNRILKRALADGFSCETSREPEALDDFYVHMYSPFIRGRHAKASTLHDQGDLKRRFLEGAGEILFLTRNGRRVAGGLLWNAPDTVYFHLLGVLGGEGSGNEVGAVYAFVLRAAMERGVETVNLGHCRPFLNDGVMKYKRILGARLAAAHNPDGGVVGFKIFKHGPALGSFLTHNPFVSVDRRGYHACVFTPEGEQPAEESRAYGAAGRRVFTLGEDGEIQESAC